MAINPKNIKVPKSTQHIVRVREVRKLVNKIEEYRDMLPSDLLSLLVDEGKGESAKDELLRDLRADGFHLNDGIARVFSEIKKAAFRIHQYAGEAQAAVDRNEFGAERIEIPVLIEKIIKEPDLFKEFTDPNPGKGSIILRQALKAGVEKLQEDSPSFREHFDGLNPVLEADWFQPDEWAENHQLWPEALRNHATDENHPYFDNTFRARLAENEACFTLGLYLASIATSRMVYEDLIKLGLIKIYGDEVKSRFNGKFGELTEMLREKTSFDWFNEGGDLYRTGNKMLHDRDVDRNLKVRGISDQINSPNEASKRRRRYRLAAIFCTERLAELIERMKSDLDVHAKKQ